MLTFTKEREVKSRYFQTENTTVLRILLKIAGRKNQKIIDLNKEIWANLFSRRISITGEYLPSVINTQADLQSSQGKHPSE